MVLQSLLNSIKERNFRGIAKQTERLDPQTRQHLQEYLHTNKIDSEELEQELQDLQNELRAASTHLQNLTEKEEFIGTRLRAYQAKLKAIQTTSTNDNDDADDDDKKKKKTTNLPISTTNKEHLQEHYTALNKIQKVHDDMTSNINILQKKINDMEKRKLELTWHLEECQVVLRTSCKLEQVETDLAAERVVSDGVVGRDEDATIPVHPTADGINKEVGNNTDEEAGHLELVDLQAKDISPVMSSESKEEEEEEEVKSEEERIHNEESIEDALASRLAVADEQV